VVPSPDGGVVVAGVTSRDGLRHDDVWLLRFAAGGELRWERIYPGERRDGAWALVRRPSGGYVVAAATASRGAGSTDAWLIAVDDHGRHQWQRVYGGAMWDRPTALAVDEGGGLFLGGYTTRPGAGYEDYWVLSLDREGRL
jgi:hypothetical protein